MEQDAEKTIVVFRKWKKGEGSGVIAIFPELLGNNHFCQMYEHIGQHGDGDPLIVSRTLPATLEEYADLKAELEGIGYNLDMRQRITQRMHANRRAAYRAFMQAQG